MASQEPVLLVVDDDVDVRDAVIDSLRPYLKIKIVAAENGLDGLKAVLTHNVVAILSDITMPQMDGMQFLSEIRKSYPELPFVFLTAYADRGNVLKALRLDVTDFLEKPFDVKELRKVAQKNLNLGLKIQEEQVHITKISSGIQATADDIKKISQIREELHNLKIAGFIDADVGKKEKAS